MSYWTNRRDTWLRKRKTLPATSYEILRRGDIDEIKAIRQTQITAYAGRCDPHTRLHHYGIPAEIIPWLRTRTRCHYTELYDAHPLNFHAGNNAKVVKVLFELVTLLSQTIMETHFTALHLDTYQIM